MSIIELKGEKKETYLTKLSASLSKAKELDLSCDAELAKIIKQTGFLRKTKDFGIYDSIRVDNESGFLHLATITDLIAKKEAAERKLSKLPSREKVVEDIIAQLHTDHPDFSKNRSLLQEIVFYDSLLKAEFPTNNPELRIEKILSVNEEPKVSEYELLIGGYDPAKMMWNYYSILLLQNNRAATLLTRDKINPAFSNYFDNACFGYGAEDVYNALNQPKPMGIIKVERNVLGPFYSGEMLSNAGIPPAIRAVLEEEPEEFFLAIEENAVENSHLYVAKDFKEEKNNPNLSKHLKLNFICSSDQLANLMYEFHTNFEHPIKCLVAGDEK